MGVREECDKCGEEPDGTLWCEDCRSKWHDKLCDDCERPDSEDYGYCPDCDRRDCDSCENPSQDALNELQEDHDQHEQYEEYLQDKLEAAGIDFLSLSDFLEEDKPKNESEEPEQPRELDEADEAERRLIEAEERKKTKGTN